MRVSSEKGVITSARRHALRFIGYLRLGLDALGALGSCLGHVLGIQNSNHVGVVLRYLVMDAEDERCRQS